MRDVDKFKEAERRCDTGDAPGGLQIHLDICINGRDERVRLQSALSLVERHRAMDHLPKLLQDCDVGTGCVRSMKELAPEAYLMGKKAEYLAVLNGVSLVAARKVLRMAPGWFAFLLEGDEAQFKELTAKIDANYEEVGRSLERALLLSEDANSHSTKAQVLLCTARVHFHRYMNLKVESLKEVRKVHIILSRLLRRYRLDEFFLFKREERANMEKCLEQCEASYLTAG